MPVIEANAPAPSAGEAPALDARTFRNAMGQFATGVVVISTEFEGHIHAMTANAFMSGSLEPPLVLVSVAHTARMHDRLRHARVFGISVLMREQLFVSNHFAGKPIPDKAPRFELLDGLAVIEGAAVQVATRLQHEYACGDHTLFVGHVTAVRTHAEPRPLLFHGGRYANLAQPETQAPPSMDSFWANNELCW